jgi:chromosome segregation ATPase
MAGRRNPSAPEWQVILEKIEEQNRVVIEAVQANHEATQLQLRELEDRLGGRIGNLEQAMGVMIVQVRGLETRMDGLETRMGGLETRVEGLEIQIRAHREVLDRRLTLIETALDRIDRESRARDAALEVAIRELRVSVRELAAEVHELRTTVQQNSADIRDLSARMAVVERLEERVRALEKRTA